MSQNTFFNILAVLGILYGIEWAAYIAECALKEAKTLIDITSNPA
jgi:hypothetical protein